MKSLTPVFGDGRDRFAWTALAACSAILAAGLARKVIHTGWQHATGEEPPLNPASPETDWREALAWSVGVGVMVGVARLAARRLAASGWRRATGQFPPL